MGVAQQSVLPATALLVIVRMFPGHWAVPAASLVAATASGRVTKSRSPTASLTSSSAQGN
ncbi:hypothetical protein [Streptomyces sp. NPDC001811]